MILVTVVSLLLGGLAGYYLAKTHSYSQRICDHPLQRGIYGDEIYAANGNRAVCQECFQLLPSLPPKDREMKDETRDWIAQRLQDRTED